VISIKHEIDATERNHYKVLYDDGFFFPYQLGHRRDFWPIYGNFAHDTWTTGAAGAVV
jgi:hypothetical protein